MEKLKGFLEKFKTLIEVVGTVGFCFSIVAILFFSAPTLENRTWVLFTAQKSGVVVAHDKGYDLSGDTSGLFGASKPIELICEAEDGKLVLTDVTNSKTYEGTYKSIGAFSFFKQFKTYTVVIDGLEGTANISSNKTLFVSVGGYSLNFTVDQ